MGFLTNIISATVKVALTPVAIVKDVVNVVTDEEPVATETLLQSVEESIEEAFDNL